MTSATASRSPWLRRAGLRVLEGSADVARLEPEQGLRARGDPAHARVPAHNDDRDGHTREDIRQVVIDASHLGAAGDQLGVDGLELLVGGPQLLRRHLELFVRRPEVVVGRDDLMIDRAQCPILSLELLDY